MLVLTLWLLVDLPSVIMTISNREKLAEEEDKAKEKEKNSGK